MQYRLLFSCVAAILSSAAALIILYRHAESIGLVDRPSERKKHVGNIPLIGGLAAFFGLLVGVCLEGQFHSFTNVLLGTSAMLALVGALDDCFDLSVRSRLLVQTGAVLIMVTCTGVYIHTLGHLFGYELELGVLGIPLTLVAVIGLLNAFNMMDGIDGLAGMLTLVSIAAIVLFQGLPQWSGAVVLLLLAAALLPHLAANLGLVGNKIFLGDAGSMVIGYLLAWTLIHLSQGTRPELSTVDVLWCVALPVMDTLTVMVRRLREGKSPFKPDRGHIHHVLLDAGLGPRTTLAALVALAVMLVFIGTLARRGLAPGSNLLVFGMLTLTYMAVVGRVWHEQQTRRAIVVALFQNSLLQSAAMFVPIYAQATGTARVHRERRVKVVPWHHPERRIKVAALQ
jgi:UDP-GlcNAc:undecaprenyl-phosphate GlcNAc-1-phosphate transferase